MKSDKTLLILAFILILAYPLITMGYIYFEAHQFQYQKFFPRMILLITLCALAYHKHDWACWALSGISVLAAIGAIVAITLHFYKHPAGHLEPLFYVQLIAYSVASLLLLWPKKDINQA